MNLQTQGIKLEGTIALTRYGGAGRGAKVSSQRRGTGGWEQGRELGGPGASSCRDGVVLGGAPSPRWGQKQRAPFLLLALVMCCVTLEASSYPSEPWEISGSGKVFTFVTLESTFSCQGVLNIQLKSLWLPASQPASFQLKILTNYVMSVVFKNLVFFF